MTIDEAKKLMRDAFKKYIDTLPCELIDGDEVVSAEVVAPILEANKVIGLALEELKWWREQDLIRRDDAIREIMDIADYYNSKSEHFAEYAVTGCGNALGILPKAEPPQFKEERSCDNCEWKGTDCWNAPEGEKVNDCTQWRRKVERNGDCETCKHYEDARRETECDSCYEMDKYEPYTPKENEQ